MAVDEGFVPWPEDVAQKYVGRGYWAGRSIAELLWDVADSCPGSTAAVDAERRLTYADLCSEADATATALESEGLRAGDTVVIQLPNCVDFVVLLLACLPVGGRTRHGVASTPLPRAAPHARDRRRRRH